MSRYMQFLAFRRYSTGSLNSSKGSLSSTLRSPSVEVAILCQFVRAHSKNYLKKTIGKRIRKIVGNRQSSEVVLPKHKLMNKVDITKIVGEEKIDENTQYLTETTKKIVHDIVNSASLISK